MNTNVLVSPSSISAKYWSELKDLSDNVKLELITLLSSSMTRPEEEKKEPRKGWASRFVQRRKRKNLARDGPAVLLVSGRIAVRQKKSWKKYVLQEQITHLTLNYERISARHKYMYFSA